MPEANRLKMGFRASNGVRVVVSKDTGCVVATDDSIPNTVIASDAHLIALREYFFSMSTSDLAPGSGRTYTYTPSPEDIIYARVEPTEAQVIAALDVYDPLFPREGNDYLPRQVESMRAALRAALNSKGA